MHLVGQIWMQFNKDAKKRGGGFGLSLLAFVILTFGALIEIVRQIL
jgi:hypothetical protein